MPDLQTKMKVSLMLASKETFTEYASQFILLRTQRKRKAPTGLPIGAQKILPPRPRGELP